MDQLANSNLAAQVPQMVALIILVVLLVSGLGFIFRYVINRLSTLQESTLTWFEKLEDKHAGLTRELTNQSQIFHRDLTSSTQKVITDNTVQLELTRDTLNRVLEKIK